MRIVPWLLVVPLALGAGPRVALATGSPDEVLISFTLLDVRVHDLHP